MLLKYCITTSYLERRFSMIATVRLDRELEDVLNHKFITRRLVDKQAG